MEQRSILHEVQSKLQAALSEQQLETFKQLTARHMQLGAAQWEVEPQGVGLTRPLAAAVAGQQGGSPWQAGERAAGECGPDAGAAPGAHGQEQPASGLLGHCLGLHCRKLGMTSCLSGAVYLLLGVPCCRLLPCMRASVHLHPSSGQVDEAPCPPNG